MVGLSLSLFLFAMVALFSSSSSVKIKSLQSICDEEITVNGDVLITLIPWFQSSCSVTLVPKNGDRLVARFTSYHFNSVRSLVGYISGRCTYESVQLASDTHPIFDRNEGYCDTFRPLDQYDLGRKGVFEYKSRDYVFSSSMRADLLVSEVYDKQGGECAKGQFDCDRKDYCISDDLTCNSYDDCGNDRDEIKGCGLTIPIIVGIVIGCICFVILVIVIGVCAAKHLKH
ncbi:hypothetical protein Btru_043366 [Bulinus truncatus]|nr:hypothetical protein Btru_043366 [Bulinus truncatus]